MEKDSVCVGYETLIRRDGGIRGKGRGRYFRKGYSRGRNAEWFRRCHRHRARLCSLGANVLVRTKVLNAL